MEGMMIDLQKRIPEDLFQNTTTSYKFFWAISLLELNKLVGKPIYSLRIIAAKMISTAVRTLENNKIRFGGADHFRASLIGLKRLYPGSFEPEHLLFERILTDINNSSIKKIVGYYTSNVPYYFLTPWVGAKVSRVDLSLEKHVFSLDAPYTIEKTPTDRIIRLNPSWSNAVSGNEDQLICRIIDLFSDFISRRNDSITPDDLASIRSIIISQNQFTLTPAIMRAIDSINSSIVSFDKENGALNSFLGASVSQNLSKEKLLTIQDPEVLSTLLPLIKSSKLEAISFLFRYYENSGLNMTFRDWYNVIENISQEYRIE